MGRQDAFVANDEGGVFARSSGRSSLEVGRTPPPAGWKSIARIIGTHDPTFPGSSNLITSSASPRRKKTPGSSRVGGLSPGLIRGDRRSTHIITWGPPSKIAWRPSRSAVAYCMGSSHNQKTRGRKTAAIWVRLHGPKIPRLSTSREGHPFTSAPYARPHRKHTDDYHGRRSQARVRALTRRAARGRSHERPA